MNKLKCLAVATIATMFLASCEREPSSSVDQDKIYTKYDIIYDKNDDKTYVRAEFRFSSALGTKLELSSPAQVKFNGEVMPFNSTWAYYEKVFTGLVGSGTFRYNDVDGNIFENTTGTIEPVEFPSTGITIQNGVDYSLAWVGDPIGANDGVTVVVDDKIFYTAITNATSITLGGSQTGDISAGPYIATMSRTIATEPDEAPLEGGAIWLTHKALNKAVDVE